MYRKETIRDYIKKATACTEAFKAAINRGDSLKVTISTGNRKIGRVMNVSMAAVLSCGNCGHCTPYCYDIKAAMQYQNTVIPARCKNYALAMNARAEYFEQIEKAISRRRTNKFFRWHVAGDIIDADYFARMVEIAKAFPSFTFWTYTKMYGIVNSYITTHGMLPENLHVMFSEWDGMPMYNPYNMPVFSCKLKDGNKDHNADYFDSLYKCPGNCDICKATGRGCVAGESAYADEH